MKTPSELFMEDLVAVCKKHNAVMFSRRDSMMNTYLSAEIQHNPSEHPIWLDFRRISPDGAE